MLKYMPDTSVIDVIKRRPDALPDDIFNRHAGHMCISSITLSGLLHGVEKSDRPEHNLNQNWVAP